MKKSSNLFSIVLLCGLILTACSSATQAAPPPAQAPASTQAPAGAPAATQAPATEAPTAAPAAAAPAIQHKDVPAATLPTSGGKKWGDYSTVSSVNPARALLGDNFSEGKFERPYNANTMDVYFPQLDIDKAVFYADDPTWAYGVITMVGRDQNNSFTGQYGIELDLNKDGFGEFLILADNPSSADWTTQGVHVYKDGNSDIGGVRPVLADSAGAKSDGYETTLFDQGSGDDPDLAWVRLDPNDPKSFQIAYKQSLLGGQEKYTAGIWAGTHLDPAMFDYNDHFTFEQAGAANPEIKAYYPIKALSELDNSCRQAIGYEASGLEPGICPK